MPELSRAQILDAITEAVPLGVQPIGHQVSPQLAGGASPAQNDVIGKNLVLFGPPGSGKSWALDHRTTGDHVLRVVFHPDYSYSDFIGAYRPVVGHDSSPEITGYDEQIRPRPVSYFDFVPGIFLQALIRAKTVAPQHVSLIIEEMNRGDCAAIFGDLLQLLDRREDGESRYGVLPAPAVGKFLKDKGVLPSIEAELRIPSNLSLLATINSSDQSLYPIDAAFKRRWQWEYQATTECPDALDSVRVADPAKADGFAWTSVWSEVNRVIMDQHRVEDKTIGPWFLAVRGSIIPIEEVQGKLLYYLWHDVFREHRSQAFESSLTTFGQLQELYADAGLAGVLAGVNLDG